MISSNKEGELLSERELLIKKKKGVTWNIQGILFFIFVIRRGVCFEKTQSLKGDLGSSGIPFCVIYFNGRLSSSHSFFVEHIPVTQKASRFQIGQGLIQERLPEIQKIE